MLYTTSIRNKEEEKEINSLVGSRYNVIDMFYRKIGAIGCSRMEVLEYSKLFNGIMDRRKQAVFANIALRPNGIIVVVNIRLSDYSWVIPYHYLSIFKTDILVIHGQGEFLKLKITGDQNKKFIAKVLKLKNEQSSQDYYG
ncbi:hypothetical protein ERX46_15035 [Brumimicrobium glaciale]|uniref:YokE-like PH domain-containing protein n=1 Tax=Brumimicrobium glaciale TaxID=200475 RepID=A0A4Q4KIU3_9FLAO|nr:hypothetical protein [Brumimicrobium glaciale]RYM32577.1 hypothetical protein ERX46_15035 [Brumimicrobium glaciale]